MLFRKLLEYAQARAALLLLNAPYLKIIPSFFLKYGEPLAKNQIYKLIWWLQQKIAQGKNEQLNMSTVWNNIHGRTHSLQHTKNQLASHLQTPGKRACEVSKVVPYCAEEASNAYQNYLKLLRMLALFKSKQA